MPAAAKRRVTFSVEEKTDKGLPVVFDNFVWFSDQELATVIRREIPSFDGSLPDAGNATDSVKAILQRLLAEKKIPGYGRVPDVGRSNRRRGGICLFDQGRENPYLRTGIYGCRCY